MPAPAPVRRLNDAVNAWAVSIAALSLAMVCLLGEQGLSRSPSLRRLAPDPRTLARLLAGLVLLGSIGAGLTCWLWPNHAPALALIPALVVALGGLFGLLWRQHHHDLVDAWPWLMIPGVLAVSIPFNFAHDAISWLLAGLGTTLTLAIALPAFAVLARRFDDASVSSRLRPVPVRVLAVAVISLALAGSLSW